MAKNLAEVLKGAPPGEWAALTPDQQTVIAYGKSVEEAAEKAKSAGVDNPFLIFVPLPEIGLAANF
jgi:hypothetical protein